MTVDLVFITYNRLDYTKLALQSVLADPSEQFSLTIWDNASTDGTAEYLKNEMRDPRIKQLVLSQENVGQTAAVNRVWGESKADLLGKLDNDCILTPGWTRPLAEAHRDIPELGVVACWHFFPDDFDYRRAKHKIVRYGKHQILRHPWTCGTGLLLKRETYERFGPMPGKATTEYWFRMALAGLVNGFYYPLVFQEHMDDPKSRYSATKTEAGFEEGRKLTVSLQMNRFQDPAGRLRWRDQVISNLLDEPYDPRGYLGWRRGWLKLTRQFRRVVRQRVRV